MDVIRYAVIVAWTKTGERAYVVVSLDERYKSVDIEAVYVGQASMVELLRQYLHDISGRLEDGQQAIVVTNHIATKTKSAHVSDFPRVHVNYSKDHARTYSRALQIAIDKAKLKGMD